MDLASFVSNGSHGPVTLLENHPQLGVLYVTVLGVAAVVGTAGNLLLLTTILLASRGPSAKPLHGIAFILNLVCSDLIVTAVINPFAIIGECPLCSVGQHYTDRSFCFFACICTSASVTCEQVFTCITILHNVMGVHATRH